MGELKLWCESGPLRAVHLSRHKWPTLMVVHSKERARRGLGSGEITSVGSEAGSYLRLIDFVYHSTLGLRVIKKKKKK